MKLLKITVICAALLAMLCCCTDSSDKKSDFAYYFAIDENEDSGKTVLYALMKKSAKDAGKESKEPSVEEFDGKNTDEAFEKFFDKHKQAYTGTVKEYAVSSRLGEKGLEEFKLYLTNSPKLPAKRKTVSVDDVQGYLSEKLDEQSE